MSRRRIFAYITIALLLFGAFLGYLLVDEPLLVEPDLDLLAPNTPEGEAAYAAFNNLTTAFHTPHDVVELYRDWVEAAGDKSAQTQFLQDNATALPDIAAALKAHTPELDRLAGEPAIDSTVEGPDSPMIDFSSIRTLWLAVALHTETAYKMNAGDADLKPLLDAYDISTRFLAGNRTLVEFMVAIVCLNVTYEGMERLLPHLSTQELKLIEEHITLPLPLNAASSRALLGEYVWVAVHISDVQADSVFSPILLNPNLSLNIQYERLTTHIHHFEKRDWAGISAYAKTLEDEISIFHVKNFQGHLMINLALPALQKVLESADDKEQKRQQLLQEVRRWIQESAN